MVAMPC